MSNEERINQLTEQNAKLKDTVQRQTQEIYNLRSELKAAYGLRTEKKGYKGARAESIRRNDKKVLADEMKEAAMNGVVLSEEEEESLALAMA